MADKDQVTRRAALGLIGTGAVLLGSETFGFTNVTGARDVNVTVAGDPKRAVLGITDNSANIRRIDKESGEIFYLDDNTGGSFDLFASDVTLVDYANCTDDCPSVFLELAENHDYAVTVSCDGTNIDTTGPMTVQIEMNGSEVSVTTSQTTNNSIETKCNGNTESSGFSLVSASNVTQNGTQEFEFSPSNSKINKGDTITIDLNDADGVDYSAATATVTSGNGSASLDSNTIVFTSDSNTNKNKSVTIDVDGYAITDSSGEYTAFFNRGSKTESDKFTVE